MQWAACTRVARGVSLRSSSPEGPSEFSEEQLPGLATIPRGWLGDFICSCQTHKLNSFYYRVSLRWGVSCCQSATLGKVSEISPVSSMLLLVPEDGSRGRRHVQRRTPLCDHLGPERKKVCPLCSREAGPGNGDLRFCSWAPDALLLTVES